jgi:hypothetical protein
MKMEEPKRTLTRQELHDLVWSTPMQKLAQQYGMSDRGLAKTCARHHVPLPPKGHWAKIKAGLPSKRSPLRKDVHSSLRTVHIGHRIAIPPSDYLAEVLAAKEEMDREDQTREETSYRAESTPIPDASLYVEIPKEQTSLEAFILGLKRTGVDHRGYLSIQHFRIAPTDVTRVAALLNSLAGELRPYGFVFSFERGDVGFAKQGSTVGFEITARRKRVVFEPGGDWDQPSHKHIGRLRLEITGTAQQHKNHWADGKVQKIERHLAEIVESFRVNFVIQRDRQAKQREIDALRNHLAHRRKLFEKRAKREVDRLNFLLRVADAMREIEDMRQTLTLLRQNGDLPPDYQRMILWAEHRLLELERETAVDRIQMMLVEKKLYADPDELFDPEGDPPAKMNLWDD